MRFRLTLSLAIASFLWDASCVSSRPTHYYTLQSTEPPAAAPGKPDGLVLLVGAIATPESLQDGRIRFRVGANQAGAYEYHRWTERPGDMVRNCLLQSLRASGKYRRVIEATSAATGDYLLRGKLLEFDEVDNAAIHTRISLQVELIDRKTNRNVWDRIIEHVEPVRAKSVADVVQSLDRNLQSVTNEAVDAIDQFLAARH
jgi:cholesterol transport system auxiliary component